MTEADHESMARAVYDATAEVYARRIGTEVTAAIEGPIDRALLGAFAELTAGGTVADVGCGPGRVAALLAACGIDVVGFDVSTFMVDIARNAHPRLQFDEGRLTALPLGDRSLVGVVCWYSIIHTPPTRLEEVFVELGRVLAESGHILVAFQAGDGESVHRADAHGSGLPLISYRHSPDDVTRSLSAAGLQVHARAVREPEFDHESTPQAFLLARRSTRTAPPAD